MAYEPTDEIPTGVGPQYEKRDEAFTKWLEDEYPFHSSLDHVNKGAYDRWLHEQKLAFNAGWAARKLADYSQVYPVKHMTGIDGCPCNACARSRSVGTLPLT